MPTWNPDQYLKFEGERTQPAIDLASRIALENPNRIIDLGCGSGNSTAVLRSRWPSAQIAGLDSSPQMIEACKQQQSGEEWLLESIESWYPPYEYDIIFSNAAFQWISDLEPTLHRLMDSLAPEGALAFQVPNNQSSPYHQSIIEVAESPRWEASTRTAKNPLTYKPSTYYYDLLSDRCRKIAIWETKYYQVMQDHQAILEWVTGTGLRPYLEALPNQTDREAFKADILEKYKQSYPQSSDRKVLFPFNRQFVVAYRH